MIKRPLSVTLIGCLLVAAGALGIAYHFPELRPFRFETLGVLLIRLLAIVSGVFMLRGRDWARWLALLWIAFHVVVSAFHSVGQFAFHAVLLAAFVFFLFRPPARAYFRLS